MISLSEKTRRKQLFLAVVISVATYLLFFFPILNKDVHFGGSDALISFYPSRFHLYESLKAGHFPFWTEKIFSGYPIYADSERAYLNVVNIAYTMIFGPFTSYKMMHFSFYLIGSLSFYLFLRRKGFKIVGFATANIIYYFSFFHLFHIQHFSFTPATFLLPTGIYLFDTYILKRQFRWLFFHLFLTTLLVYFGSFQSVVLYLLANFLYFVIFAKGVFSFRSQIFMLALYLFSVALLCAPQLLPTLQLYLLSNRFLGGQIFTQGSFNPLMLVNLIYPYFFGYGSAYKWNSVSEEFFIHETYIYVGVVTTILAFLGLLTFKDKRLRHFLVGLVVIFAFLGFIAYIPLFNRVSLPIIGWFRYWGRSVVLFNFAVAIFAAYFVSYPGKVTRKDFVKNRYTMLGLLVYFFIMFLVNIKHQTTALALQEFLAGSLVIDGLFILWISFLLLTLAFLFIVIKKQSQRMLLFIVALLITDLYIFGVFPVVSYTENISNIYPEERVVEMREFKKRRVVHYDPQNSWNKSLYYDSWGVFGYGPYIPKSYSKFMSDLSIPVGGESRNLVNPSQNLADLGVSKFVYGGKITAVISQNKNDLIPNFKGLVFNPVREEGLFRFILLADEPQEVETKIRNYPGWEIHVDGEKHKFSNAKDAAYLSFFVQENESETTLKFVPKVFYVGLALMSLGFFSVIALAYTHYLAVKRKI